MRVGRVLAKLDAMGITDETVVVSGTTGTAARFLSATSDHRAVKGESGADTESKSRYYVPFIEALCAATGQTPPPTDPRADKRRTPRMRADPHA